MIFLLAILTSHNPAHAAMNASLCGGLENQLKTFQSDIRGKRPVHNRYSNNLYIGAATENQESLVGLYMAFTGRACKEKHFVDSERAMDDFGIGAAKIKNYDCVELKAHAARTRKVVDALRMSAVDVREEERSLKEKIAKLKSSNLKNINEFLADRMRAANGGNAEALKALKSGNALAKEKDAVFGDQEQKNNSTAQKMRKKYTDLGKYYDERAGKIETDHYPSLQKVGDAINCTIPNF